MSDYLLNLRKFLEDRGGNPTEALNCVSICDEYYEALRLLGKYDEGEFGFADDSLKKEFYVPKKDVAVAVIEGLKKFLQNRGEKVDVFGVPRDGNFDNFFSAFNLIMQNYGGTDLYPESEEKLANLFYFLVKNHYFLDGNKRIASVIFLWMIEMNNLMLQEKFGKVLTHTMVYRLAILVAQSETENRRSIVQFLSIMINIRKYPILDSSPPDF